MNSSQPALPSRYESRTLSVFRRLVNASTPTTKLGFWIIRLVGTALGAVVGYLFLPAWPAAVIGAILGLIAANSYLGYASGSRLRQFVVELPDVLLSLANALKASYSLSQAITRTAGRGHGLAAQELQVSADQITLGARPLQAMKMLSDRMSCPEMDYVMLALGIHDTVGGDLAKTLESAASTIQQRIWLQGEIRAATAEARISSVVVCGIPLAFIFIITRLVPHYYDAMLSSVVGDSILALIGFLILTAFWVVRRMQAAAEKV